MLYQPVRKLIAAPFVHTVQRPRITGLENFPMTGPAILAANHVGFMEAITLCVAAPRVLTFPVKREWFEGPGPHGKALGWFLRDVRQIPVDRSGGAAGVAAMSASQEVLEAGEMLAIFPEGTRSPDGRLYRGHTGIARLIMATGAPVLPVGIRGIGSERSTKRAELHFGGLLHFEAGMGNGKRAREMTDEIMQVIQMLSGQEYVEQYARDVKKQLAAGGKRKPQA